MWYNCYKAAELYSELQPFELVDHPTEIGGGVLFSWKVVNNDENDNNDIASCGSDDCFH